MKTYTFILLVPITLFLFSFESGLAQTKQEVVQWLNNNGEAYLKDITGNDLLYWEVESNGTLKITNRKSNYTEHKEVIKTYRYLNVYQLDSKGPLITGGRNSKELVLRCKVEAGDCIKARYYYTNTNSKTEALPSVLFSLKERFSEDKGEELEEKLLLLIQLVNGRDTGSDRVSF